MKGYDDSASWRPQGGPFETALTDPSTNGPSREINPTSALLQGMIQEKRAEKQRTGKATSRQASSQKHELDSRDVQSSPITSARVMDRPGMQARRSSGIAVKSPTVQKEMGLREMQEHISKINKQNFDLKLDLFYCRQRNQDLESKLKRVEMLEADNAEMQAANEAIVRELESRDRVLGEAAEYICDLEAKMDDLQCDSREIQSSLKQEYTNELQSSDCTIERSAGPRIELPRTPPQMERSLVRSTDSLDQAAHRHRSMLAGTAPPEKISSFLREHKKSTGGLRSLYSYGDSVTQGNPSFVSLNRPGSLFSGDDDEDNLDRLMLNSPRLSILSESGFSSIYGSPKDRNLILQQDDSGISRGGSPAVPQSSPTQRNVRREARINDWMEEKNGTETPSQQPPKTGTSDRFSSIGEVLQVVPRVSKDRLPRDRARTEHSVSPQKTRCEEHVRREVRSPSKGSSNQVSRERTSSTASRIGSNYGGKLPPTPDTMSTHTMGANSSTQSIITEKSLHDGARPHSKGYSSLVGSGRPHTSDSNFAYRLSHAVTFNEDVGFDGSDDEQASTRVEKSDMGDGDDGHAVSQASPFMGGSVKATRFFGVDGPARPPLKTHATDMMFNGEGLPTPRTVSFPSPTLSVRNHSGGLSPSSQRSSGMISERTATRSSKDSSSNHTTTATPTKSSPRYNKPRSPSVPREPTSPSPQIADHTNDADPANHQRSTSDRFRFAKTPFPSNNTIQQSVTSRLFRRSNSQTTNTLPANSIRPQAARVISSSQAQPRLPRASSLYATSRPGTADGPLSHAPAPPTPNPRRHSAILDHPFSASYLPTASNTDPHQRRVSESRQTNRADESKGGWALGRSASAKIREGFGFGGKR